jgi:hypothetical protein
MEQVMKAKFRTTQDGDILCLWDDANYYKTMSITNDAEAVVEWAHNNVSGFSRILYMDTEGLVDELLFEGGKFTGFNHIKARSMYGAIQKIRGARQ